MTEVHPMLAIDVAREPSVARAILDDLRRTAESDPDPVRRELAREVVEGRLTARQVASYAAYGEVLAARLDDVVARWNTLSESEREERATAGWAELGEPAGAEAGTVEQLMELVAEVRHEAG
jgi:hypothetical protein